MTEQNIIGSIMPLVIVISLVFILVYPVILNTIIRLHVRDRRCMWIPPVIGISAIAASIAAITGGARPSSTAVPEITFLILFTISTVSAAAVITSYSFFRPLLHSSKERRNIMIASLIQLPLLFALLVNPESWSGGSLPLFADRLPGLGLVFDAIAGALGTAGKAGYNAFFTSGVVTGFYIEVAVGTALILAVMATMARNMSRSEGREP